MKTPSSTRLPMRKRSPSRAPPLTELCGSQASTATVCPCRRTTSIILPMSVLLPTPPLPVKATTRLGTGRGRAAGRQVGLGAAAGGQAQQPGQGQAIAALEAFEQVVKHGRLRLGLPGRCRR